jgi:hypothetical protein
MSTLTEDPAQQFANPMPENVQQQYDEAMRLAAPPPEGNDGQAPTPVPEPAAVAPQPATSEAPSPTPPTEVAAAPAQPPLPEETLETWKQRAKVFQGRLAVKARVEEELRQAHARITELEKERQAAVRPEPAMPVAPAPVPQPKAWTEDDISDDDVTKEYSARQVENLGMDVLKVMLAKRRSDMAQIEAKLAAKTAGDGTTRELQEEMRQQIAKQRDDQFFAELTQLCPQWQAMTDHPQFAAFEAAMEPRSGSRYNRLLSAARADGDAERVMHILDDFRVFVNGAAKPAAAPAPEQPHVRILPSPAEQASIANSVTASRPNAPQKRRYTAQEWKALEKEANDIQNEQPQKSKALFEELVAAVAEERVSGFVG